MRRKKKHKRHSSELGQRAEAESEVRTDSTRCEKMSPRFCERQECVFTHEHEKLSRNFPKSSENNRGLADIADSAATNPANMRDLKLPVPGVPGCRNFCRISAMPGALGCQAICET